jgi:multidrug efflux pump subunit AcrA (membrane-fusion protein)
MYVYGYVNIQRNGVMTIPSRCVARRGDSRVVFLYKDGKSQQVEVRASTSDGDWIEILAWNKGGNWVSAEATDQVILGDPDELSDGIDVELNKAADPS